MRDFLKNVSYCFVSDIVSMLLGVVSVLLFPKFIGIEDFGYYQLYIFYTGYIVVTSLGWGNGVYLKYGGKQFEDIDVVNMSSHFWLLVISQIVIYAGLSIAILTITDVNKRTAMLVVCICGVINQPRLFLTQILQATGRFKEYAYAYMIERVFSICGGLCAILFGCKSFIFLIFLDTLGRFLAMLVVVWSCRKIVFCRPYFTWNIFGEIKNFMRAGMALLVASLASSLILGVIRFAIENYWDIETFSKISFTISLLNMIVRCINAIGIVMFPTLRKLNEGRLPAIFLALNSCIAVLVFGGLIFYQPCCVLLKLWLPQYEDSLRYAAILLPACLYECKNAILIGPYLKVLREEKIFLVINVIPIIFSSILALITVYILHSIKFAVVAMLISLMFRCLLGELFLAYRLNMGVKKSIIFDIGMTLIFIISNCYIGVYGFLFYLGAYILFCLILREQLKNIYINLKNYFGKEKIYERENYN